MRNSRALGALLVAALLVACKGEPPRQSGSEVSSTSRRYTVRGEIVQLTASEHQGTEMMLRHEPIDDFADRTGQVVGMGSMVMPFLVERPASLAGIAVGDKVAVVFVLDWAGPTFRVERVDRLPADTSLRFGPARPAVGSGAR